MPDTTTTIIGNLTDNPEVRYTEAGIARARFGSPSAAGGSSSRPSSP
jgi:single-stranded DNA-binding protein